jgi:DNA repair exonuclease SbcCD nuclease subunit
MNKIICLSDPHLLEVSPVSRIDNVMETSKRKILEVFQFSIDHDNAPILISGDLTDKPRLWRILETLSESIYQYGIEIFTVPGQHDKYFRNQSGTILSVLRAAGLIKIAGEKPIDLKSKGKSFQIYGCGWGDIIPDPIEPGARNILLVHAPLSLEKKPFETGSAKAFLKRFKNKYRLIVFGDIHKKVFLETKNKNGEKVFMVNSGPLFRKEFTEEMIAHKPGFWVFDTIYEKLSFEEVSHDPPEKVFGTKTTNERKSVLDLEDFKERLLKTKRQKGDVSAKAYLMRYVNENKPGRRMEKLFDLLVSGKKLEIGSWD